MQIRLFSKLCKILSPEDTKQRLFLMSFIGWLSLTDVVRLALEGQKSNSEHFWKNKLRTTYVSDVVKSQGSQDLAGTLSPHIDEHWSLLSIMEMMARLHVKHFAVCNDNGRVQSVITDSMVASLADQWATDAEQAFNTLTVEQMMQNSLPKCMLTIDKHTETGKAFQQMIDNSIDKVGVTDSDLDGCLVDVINLRNVRGLEGDNVLIGHTFRVIKRQVVLFVLLACNAIHC